mgnify:CR=1 FL=1
MKPELTLILIPAAGSPSSVIPANLEHQRRSEIAAFFAKHSLPHQIIWRTEATLGSADFEGAEGRYVVVMDHDLRVPLSEIFPLLQTLTDQNVPFTFAARKLPADHFDRRWRNALNEKLGSTFHDPFSPHWLGTAENFRSLSLSRPTSIELLGPELLRASRQKNYKVLEVPIKLAAEWPQEQLTKWAKVQRAWRWLCFLCR